MKTLYVGNIPWSANDDKLMDHFSQSGTVVSAKIVTDKETGRSKGFGFVEMENDDDAKNAVDQLDGTSFDGRTIKVNFKQERSGNRPTFKRSFNRADTDNRSRTAGFGRKYSGNRY